MSSPMMTRMFGFDDCGCCADAGAITMEASDARRLSPIVRRLLISALLAVDGRPFARSCLAVARRHSGPIGLGGNVARRARDRLRAPALGRPPELMARVLR